VTPDVSPEGVHIDGEGAPARSHRTLAVSHARDNRPPSLVELARHARGVRALLADPAVSSDQRRQLMALEAEVVALQQDAAVEAQRAEAFARAEAARAARAERVRVHPGTHPGPCPPPGAMTVSRAQVAENGAGQLHLDVDQVAPSWWPQGGPRSVDVVPRLIDATTPTSS
jgi:hypothetical protein